MEFFVEPVWPWPVVLVTSAALGMFVMYSYRSQAGSLTPSRRRWLAGFKLAALALLIWAMFRPSLQYSDTDDNSAQLLVALDVSRSMNTADGPANATRLQAAQQELLKQTDRWKTLGERVTVRQFEFDRDLRPRREDLQTADGDQTALGTTLESLLREARQERTLGILLLSDGAQRAVPPNDSDPLLAARQLATEQTPVYPVGFGGTSLSTTTADVALEDLLVDPVVFERKLVPLKVQLSANGARRKTARLRVMIEDRQGLGIGQSGTLVPAKNQSTTTVQTEVTIEADQETKTVDLSFIPDRPGELKIAVEVDPIDGELLTRNNRVETIISVRQGGLRVAYFDLIRPEQRALRMVNGADKIQLDYYSVRGGRANGAVRLDPAAFERGAYDVYILGDIPVEAFGPALLSKLAERVREGAGLMMVGGLQNYSAGGYGSSPLADYLPVALTPAPAGRPKIDLSGQQMGPQPMVPTETGLKRYVMQLAATEKNRNVWASLAPLVGATKLQPKSELVEVWAETQNGIPLLCAAEVGRSRIVAFGGDTTYQWVLHGQALLHQRFWRQMILWLAHKEADTDQNVWAKVEPRNFFPGTTAPIEFGARSDSGEPINDATFTVEITKPDGTRTTASPQKSAELTFAEFAETQQPGDYWVRVSARRNDAQVGIDATTRFIIDPRDLELDRPNADYETLSKIAELTGGELLRPEDLDRFLERLAGLKLEALTRVTAIPLWDNVWVLLAFVAVMTGEWALRKRWGLA